MKITLLDITTDAENKIGLYASVCYDAKVDRDSNIRRAKQVSERGHLACLRFASATFNISGISRVCSHQFVRSKHLDFLQRSQRYCKEDLADFVLPEHLPEDLQLEFAHAYERALTKYQKLLSLGVRKEDARFVLPEATCTELNVSGNLQSWMDFIKLRADKHAQWEIRQVAIEINNLLAKECPNLFKHMENI